MIPNIHQSIDDIIRAATPEQKILWQNIRLLTGENAAVQQIHFMGLIPADFTTYSANKLFLITKAVFSFSSMAPQNNPLRVQVYNEANQHLLSFQDAPVYYDTVANAARYEPATIEARDFYFSRIVTTFEYVQLTGYKLTR